MKGTGRWTVQEAAEQSVAAPTIAAALDSRYLSARKDERLKASKILKGPTEMPSVSKEQVRDLIFSAILLDEIVLFQFSILMFCSFFWAFAGH
jgi:6-phosphogluconate dehydrogenase